MKLGCVFCSLHAHTRADEDPRVVALGAAAAALALVKEYGFEAVEAALCQEDCMHLKAIHTGCYAPS